MNLEKCGECINLQIVHLIKQFKKQYYHVSNSIPYFIPGKLSTTLILISGKLVTT